MRPDPSRPQGPPPSQAVSDGYAESRNAYIPRHLAGAQQAELKRLAVLLPFSSTNAEVKKQSEGIYNAIQMALFQVGARDIVLMRRDATSADARVISGIAEDAIRDGALAVIGPVFAQQVAPVAAKAAEVHAPVFAFSTDLSAIGQGAYLVSLTPYSEVERIVDWATKDGVTRFAMLGPNNANSRTIDGSGTGSFTSTLSSLTSSTTYYLRAYAKNAAGYGYGNTLTLITPSPVVTGVWNNLNGGSWPTTGNWQAGGVPTSIGSTANFGTLNITAARTVTIGTGVRSDISTTIYT
jgi:hypothetical protein